MVFNVTFGSFGRPCEVVADGTVSCESGRIATTFTAIPNNGDNTISLQANGKWCSVDGNDLTCNKYDQSESSRLTTETHRPTPRIRNGRPTQVHNVFHLKANQMYCRRSGNVVCDSIDRPLRSEALEVFFVDNNNSLLNLMCSDRDSNNISRSEFGSIFNM